MKANNSGKQDWEKLDTCYIHSILVETYDVISFRSFGFEITLKRFFKKSCCRDFQTT